MYISPINVIIKLLIITLNKGRFMNKNKFKWWYVFWLIPVFASVIAIVSALWYARVYGDIGFDAILFTLCSSLKGTATGITNLYIWQALVPSIAITIIVWLYLFTCFNFTKTITVKKRKVTIYPVNKKLSAIIAIVSCFSLLLFSGTRSGFNHYFFEVVKDSELYENEYVDPNTVNITFPEKKRNLIYIYLESVETTLYSKDVGGARDENIIPELYKLAHDNINFSDTQNVGGFKSLTGSTWTIGAMVAQTAGIPLKLPGKIGGDDGERYKSFLPGVTSLSDILNKNDYYQALMIGSISEFGGRKQYFTQHHVDRIYDYNSAIEDKFIPEDYKVWWGFEDEKLFTYARQELPKIAAGDKPFSFTLLTADTHFPGGYMSDACDNKFEAQYDNVYASSSRQVNAFIEWCKTQDFYENTTIIICGDHPTMDQPYIGKYVEKDYPRRVYNCIINAPLHAENSKNRKLCSMDMFPTTLAAMGCKIDGDKLGLGVNLFSDQQTLCERFSYDEINDELAKTSKYYDTKFLPNDTEKNK